MTAPDTIKRLVDKFHNDIEFYKSPDYDESKARQEFINPFFEALGWNVRDQSSTGEVVYETRVRVEGRLRRPDYGFRINQKTRFFGEAKKPSVNLDTNNDAAFQVRSYGWSATLPVSVLTDFEEFSIYDCRIQPNHSDRAAQGRIEYIGYQDYEKKWDELEARFSRTAVLNNQLEAWIEGQKQRGTLAVDQAFLTEMEAWRVMLADDVALHNPGLSPRQLNIAVQSTIDRIVFLRICEDREIEVYGGLQRATYRDGVYAELLRLFHLADDRYNSGLFHFKSEPGQDEPDVLSLRLHMSDDTLQHIISRMYYPNPYAFDVIPADILGQIYERFLGKVIELQPGKGAVVVEKPEVRKAGGVYYTPTYIVDYIVQNTVGQLVESKTPDQVAKLKILDPACGSGSFLLGAFQFMIDWHLKWYEADGITKHEKAKRVRPLGDVYTLTTQEKKRILVNNLYGVDLDQQAVEVTKLSLLLKVLEGETTETTQLNLFKERVLPDLDNNIKWGNSLVNSEYFEEHQQSLFDEEENFKVKVFDWHKPDGFDSIMDAGGFDAIIGNPPYIRIQTMREWSPEIVGFYKRHYAVAGQGNYDVYLIFVEKGLRLLKTSGRLGYILPHKFFNAQYGSALREMLSGGRYTNEIVHFGHQQVFAGAATYTCLLFLQKAGSNQFKFTAVSDLKQWQQNREGKQSYFSAMRLGRDEWNLSSQSNHPLFERLQEMPYSLGKLTTRISQGIRTSANEVYVLEVVSRQDNLLSVFSQSLNRVVQVEADAVLDFLQGREIKPYHINSSGRVVIVPYSQSGGKTTLITESEIAERWPYTYAYLSENREFLEGRERGRMRNASWYGYVYPKNIDLMKSPKLIVPDIASQASYAIDYRGKYAFTSGYGIELSTDMMEAPEYVLGLLNSRVLDFYLKQVSTVIRGGYFRFFTQFMEQLPIRRINFSNHAESEQHHSLVEAVKSIQELHLKLTQATSTEVRKNALTMIEGVEGRINNIVYELYSLTDEEIAIVEDRQQETQPTTDEEESPAITSHSSTSIKEASSSAD